MLRVCFLSCTVLHKFFYGAQVCALCDGVIEICNIAHRTALRRIFLCMP